MARRDAARGEAVPSPSLIDAERGDVPGAGSHSSALPLVFPTADSFLD